ncbi:hypothetical protein T492DRAFT_1024818 [Pavlovales sp. CCMP2436]|nr:hypothetical protein T492DRAFT_1024818 [Pavlovales sp. CCMP2436]
MIIGVSVVSVVSVGVGVSIVIVGVSVVSMLGVHCVVRMVCVCCDYVVSMLCVWCAYVVSTLRSPDVSPDVFYFYFLSYSYDTHLGRKGVAREGPVPATAAYLREVRCAAIAGRTRLRVARPREWRCSSTAALRMRFSAASVERSAHQRVRITSARRCTCCLRRTSMLLSSALCDEATTALATASLVRW